MNALVPRATIAEICLRRDAALAEFGQAHDALVAAAEAVSAAVATARSAAPLASNRYNHHVSQGRREGLELVHWLQVPPREEYLAEARRIVDTDVWAHLVEVTDLKRLMDKKAKDELGQQLLKDPPEVTIDTVVATLETLSANAAVIFQRGVAECFSNLDRRFRSHDGWKIGSRVVLTYAFDAFGMWSFRGNHRDTLLDIERAFFVLDGRQPPADYLGVIGALENARAGTFGPRQGHAETEFFRVRSWMNGNVHLWFKRDDLLAKVNQLLGEYYRAPIPEERAAEPDTGLHRHRTGIARNFAFYPTPAEVVERVLRDVPLYRQHDEQRLTVLEPSAGTGSIAAAVAARGAVVDCVEIQAGHAKALRLAGVYRSVINCDFMQLRPDPGNLYDRIVMNPPFDTGRDIDHVLHAMTFLKPGGHLTAIMSAGTEFRSDRKTESFRAAMNRIGAEWSDLPPRSFASVGTNCNTIVLRTWNREACR